jgi:hypothetical protein
MSRLECGLSTSTDFGTSGSSWSGSDYELCPTQKFCAKSPFRKPHAARVFSAPGWHDDDIHGHDDESSICNNCKHALTGRFLSIAG